MESRVFHMKWLYHLYFYPRCHNDNAKILILTCDSRYVRNKRNDFCAFVLGMDYYISWYIWLQKYSGTWYNNSGVRDMSQTCIVVTCEGHCIYEWISYLCQLLIFVDYKLWHSCKNQHMVNSLFVWILNLILASDFYECLGFFCLFFFVVFFSNMNKMNTQEGNITYAVPGILVDHGPYDYLV